MRNTRSDGRIKDLILSEVVTQMMLYKYVLMVDLIPYPMSSQLVFFSTYLLRYPAGENKRKEVLGKRFEAWPPAKKCHWESI